MKRYKEMRVARDPDYPGILFPACEGKEFAWVWVDTKKARFWVEGWFFPTLDGREDLYLAFVKKEEAINFLTAHGPTPGLRPALQLS